jgi:hypothetical protein
VGPLPAQIAAHLQKRTGAEEAEGKAPLPAHPPGQPLLGVYGACAYLSPAGSCLLHERFGSAGKLVWCRLFPVRILAHPDGLRVHLADECPCVDRLPELPRADLERAAEDLLAALPVVPELPPTVPLTRTRTITLAELGAWERDWERLLADARTPGELRDAILSRLPGGAGLSLQTYGEFAAELARELRRRLRRGLREYRALIPPDALFIRRLEELVRGLEPLRRGSLLQSDCSAPSAHERTVWRRFARNEWFGLRLLDHPGATLRIGALMLAFKIDLISVARRARPERTLQACVALVNYGLRNGHAQLAVKRALESFEAG